MQNGRTAAWLIEHRKNSRKSAQRPPTGWRLLPSRLVAARQRCRSRRTVLAIKGFANAAPNGAPLTAPCRSA